jgi:hypothetical protein
MVPLVIATGAGANARRSNHGSRARPRTGADEDRAALGEAGQRFRQAQHSDRRSLLEWTAEGYARDDRPWSGSDPPGVAYIYAPDRKAERPLTHLAGFDQIPRQVRFLLRKAKAFQLNLAELTQGHNPALRLITRDLRRELRAPNQTTAMVPLVIATGAGANARRSLGISVFSGMIASTCLAVVFVPSFFVVLQKFEESRKSRKKIPRRGGTRRRVGGQLAESSASTRASYSAKSSRTSIT